MAYTKTGSKTPESIATKRETNNQATSWPQIKERSQECAVIGCKLKQNANEGCNSCASLAGRVLSFIARFTLLVIAPYLPNTAAIGLRGWSGRIINAWNITVCDFLSGARGVYPLDTLRKPPLQCRLHFPLTSNPSSVKLGQVYGTGKREKKRLEQLKNDSVIA